MSVTKRLLHGLLHGGQVVSFTSFEQMTVPTVVASGDTISYGYGLSLSALEGHREIVHGGTKPGYLHPRPHGRCPGERVRG